MPLKLLLSETCFNADQTEIIAKAFDDAWAQIQREHADPAMASLIRTAIAKRIIEMAQGEGMNARSLCDDAVSFVRNNPLWPAPAL
jgi:hypothetical protein